MIDARVILFSLVISFLLQCTRVLARLSHRRNVTRLATKKTSLSRKLWDKVRDIERIRCDNIGSGVGGFFSHRRTFPFFLIKHLSISHDLWLALYSSSSSTRPNWPPFDLSALSNAHDVSRLCPSSSFILCLFSELNNSPISIYTNSYTMPLEGTENSSQFTPVYN